MTSSRVPASPLPGFPFVVNENPTSVLLGAREETDRLGHVLLALPVDIAADLLSLSPIVDEKYPTLQMPSFSRYISLINLNLLRRCKLDAAFSARTASPRDVGRISI